MARVVAGAVNIRLLACCGCSQHIYNGALMKGESDLRRFQRGCLSCFQRRDAIFFGRSLSAFFLQLARSQGALSGSTQHGCLGHVPREQPTRSASREDNAPVDGGK